MKRIGRNDPCPCGSGRKFKKCHWGKEEEIALQADDLSPEEMGRRIMALPSVDYGRSREIAESLNLKELTGREIGIKFLDLKAYSDLGLLGSGHQEAARGNGGGVFVNPYKTAKADPQHLYIAVSPDVDDSTLIHELAHVLTYLGDPGQAPGTLDVLGLEAGIPVDHLEHPAEFGYWLDDLQKRFDIVLDADDAIILYLYRNGQLIKGEEIRDKNGMVLKVKSERIFRFLSQKSEEINGLIKDLPGYIGPREQND